jgi:hypothetical protein
MDIYALESTVCGYGNVVCGERVKTSHLRLKLKLNN